MKKNKSSHKKVIEANRPLLITLLTILSLIYAFWRLFFTIPTKSGWIALIIGTGLVLSECTTIFGAIVHFVNAARVCVPKMPEIEIDDFPTVDIFIPTYDESTDILFKTLNGCINIEYPDKSKINFYLCDDGNRPEMRQLAKDFNVNYFHAPDNSFAKAGNLNYAISKTQADYIVIFDADMIPRKKFLLETIPYFLLPKYIYDDKIWRKRTEDEPFTDKQIAFVQTRQSFYNKDIFQFNLNLDNRVANEQDYFHREVNVARLNMNSVMFAGSNGVIARHAFEAVGGFPTYSITEDLALSIELWDKGFQGFALDKTLAHGMAPETAEGIIKQRSRWSRGAAQCLTKPNFWFRKMSLSTKFGFFMAYAHWWTYVRRFIFITAPIAYGVFGIQIAHIEVWQLIFLFIPYLLVYNYSLKKMSRGRLSAFYSALTDTILFPFLLWPIIAGTLSLPKSKFEVTPKENIDKRNSSLIYTIPFIILIMLYIVTIFQCIYNIIYKSDLGALPVIYWSFYNLLALVHAVIFYVGKKLTKSDLMMDVKLPITLTNNLDSFTFESAEMGDDIFSTTESLQTDDLNNKTFEGQIDWQDETINFHVKFYSYNSYTNETVFEIVDWNQNSKRQYLEMLYDRPIALPKTVHLNYFHGVALLLNQVISNLLVSIHNFKKQFVKT